jgi:hypothetical protein
MTHPSRAEVEEAGGPSFSDQLSCRHWGDIAWARPPQDHVTHPSWLGRGHEIPIVRRIDHMDFGERV